jgi:hypothetical protein
MRAGPVFLNLPAGRNTGNVDQKCSINRHSLQRFQRRCGSTVLNTVELVSSRDKSFGHFRLGRKSVLAIRQWSLMTSVMWAGRFYYCYRNSTLM